MSGPGDGKWYWCFEHATAEPEGSQCRAEDRLGPYGSREEAVRWREKAEARDERWRQQDREWEGDDDWDEDR